MITVSLNQQTLKVDTTRTKTLGDLITLVNGHINDDQVITGISHNHIELDNESQSESLVQFNNGTLTIQTQNRLEFAFGVLDTASCFLDILIESTQTVSNLYDKNETVKADTLFINLIDRLGLFIEMVTQVHKTFKIGGNFKLSTGRTLHDLEIHLLSVLKAITKAKELGDLVMLCDLIEHELLDNLKQWKIAALPELKNQKTV